MDLIFIYTVLDRNIFNVITKRFVHRTVNTELWLLLFQHHVSMLARILLTSDL